jgi:heme/copper-type cytochrome/quinol oxidase subunit 4
MYYFLPLRKTRLITMEEFFTNISRYPRYLISFSLGILLTFLSPLLPLFKRPTTAIAAVGLLVAAFICLSFILRAMLGLEVSPL